MTGRTRTGRPPRVVKVGGREIRPGPELDSFASWASELHRTSGPLVIVHGGGDEVSALSERLGLPALKVAGQRVTTPEVLPLVEGVLAGPVSLRLVSALNRAGLRALGLSGVSGEMVQARDAQAGLLGRVGEPTRVDAAFLQQLLLQGIVPVFAPLASDGEGGVLNVNADHFAAGIAEALGGELVLLTDVPGVLDSEGRLLGRLTPSGVRALVADGTVHGGMVPKVEAALRVLSNGAKRVWIGPFGPTALPGGLRGGTWFVPEGAPLEGRAPRARPTSPRGRPLAADPTYPLLPLRLGAGAG